jgi:hypothetical protein
MTPKGIVGCLDVSKNHDVAPHQLELKNRKSQPRPGASRMKHKIIKQVALLMFIAVGSTIITITYIFDRPVNPVDMRGIRENSYNAILLDFSAIKESTNFELKDRTVAHFDISSLWGDVSGSTLNLGILNLDPEPPPGKLEIYAFTGDGTVSTDELASGTLFRSLSGLSGNVQTVTIDISALLVSAIRNGDNYLSFNLRASDSDRYFLQSTIVGVTKNSGIESAGKVEGPTFIDLPNAATLGPGTLVLLGTVCLLGVGLVVIGVRKVVRRVARTGI